MFHSLVCRASSTEYVSTVTMTYFFIFYSLHMCVTYTYIYILFIYALLRVRIVLETHKNPQFVDNFPNKFLELSKIKQLPRYHTESDNSITIANGTMQPP